MTERTFDRIPSFDRRSAAFPIRALVAGKTPRSYSWRHLQLDQGPDGACFPAGTLVRLADGSHRPIEQVGLLDSVVTAEGRYGTVVRTMVHRSQLMTTVKIRGHLPLRCTPDHPVLTTRGYVPAGRLLRSDHVAITRWAADAGDEFIETRIDQREFRGVLSGLVNTGGVQTEVTPVPALLAKSPALGRLLGLYAAEGHTTANKVVWSYGGHEIDTLVAETVDLVKSVFDSVARVQVRPNGAVNVVLYGKAWRLLFERLVPGTSKHGDKHLGAEITNGPAPYRRAILDGWLDGDGHARRHEHVGMSVCKRLSLDMHAIANGLGLQPAIRTSRPTLNAAAATRQRRYEMTIPKGDGSNRPAQDDAAIWRKVSEVWTDPFDGWAYNLHVEGDESYVANGVGVHNCTGFAVTMEAAARPMPVFGDPVHGHVDLAAVTATAVDVYHRARLLDEWPGEDYDGSSVTGAMEAGRERHWYNVYRWAFGDPEVRAGDAILAIGYHGPVVVGANWYNDMFTADRDGYLHPSGGVAGGHAFLLSAYSKIRDAVWTPNSWGGEGQGWIRRHDLATLLADDGEACIPVWRLGSGA